MTIKVVMTYDPALVENLPNGARYRGSILADNEIVPSYGLLIQMLQMAMAEVQGSQPNIKRGETKDGNDTASKTESEA